MRLVSLLEGSNATAAMVVGNRVVPLSRLDPLLPADLTEIVLHWPRFRDRLRWLDAAQLGGIPLREVRLGIPFEPPRILGTGGNYRDHLGELHTERTPEAPSAFLKLPGSAQGPEVPLALAPADACVDYEGEIALVIGAPARDLPTERAHEAIAGLMLANDVSARDAPLSHVTLAKGGRGFCPLGPWLVTTDELDLGNVSFTVEVNGEPRQSASSATMIHTFAEIVASYSRAIPLEPGDVVLTGTPAGVGLARRPPAFLRPGDVVVIDSPQLGTLRTPIVATDA